VHLGCRVLSTLDANSQDPIRVRHGRHRLRDAAMNTAVEQVFVVLPDVAAWGPCSPTCTADLNGDSIVNGSDIAVLLDSWGQCP